MDIFQPPPLYPVRSAQYSNPSREAIFNKNKIYLATDHKSAHIGHK
jgi:hypothetical protein